MYNKIGIVGEKSVAIAFKSIGVDVFYADDSITAREQIKKLDREGYAVIFLTENLLSELTDFLERYKTRPYPAIIPVPAASGAGGMGLAGLKKDMEKAIGFDILSKND